MVKLRLKIGVCAVWLLLAASVVIGKEWRGIVPLTSTRADVQRVLRVPQRANDSLSYYKLANEIVVVHFDSERCDTDMGKLGYAWNVPPGTVTSIAVIPRGSHRLEEYKSANFKIDDPGAGFVYYTDAFAGFTVETYKNLVTLVEYYPEATQNNFRCPRITDCCIDFFPAFDEYETIPFADEKERLNNFGIQLDGAFWRGTIQVLGPTKEARQQGLKLAARAKRYLVKERGLEPERLLIVDAGFHESGMTRLAEHSIGGPGTRIHLYTEKDPENRPRTPARKFRR